VPSAKYAHHAAPRQAPIDVNHCPESPIIMTVARTIRDKLSQALAPSHLEVVDDSARHAGHAGARDGGESHFNVLVVSDRFAGLSRVARQRLVYDLLREELAGPVHALSLVARAPGE
jgi:BolA protein